MSREQSVRYCVNRDDHDSCHYAMHDELALLRSKLERAEEFAKTLSDPQFDWTRSDAKKIADKFLADLREGKENKP